MAKKQQPQASIRPIIALDPNVPLTGEPVPEELDKVEKEEGILEQIVKSINAHQKVQRMAFEVDPSSQSANSFGSIYKQKTRLVPDEISKRITGPLGDDLVCAILQARSNHIGAFGRPRSDRFSFGFQFDPLKKDIINREDYHKIKDKLDHLKEVMWNCGYRGLYEESAPNLSQFLKMITRSGLTHGRVAVEFISVKDPETGEKKFHSFRAVDAGTIYKIIPKHKQDGKLRAEAIRLLKELKQVQVANQLESDVEYKYVQVIDNRPVQIFTDDELVVYNLYPVTNVEYNGYPLTPIDQALNAILTHINITIHNKLYFQNGRAARGIIVVQSDSVDEASLQRMRQQFYQTINSVKNSWRTPIFGVGSEDNISFQNIDTGSRDAEFTYLSDNNARVILSAFQISPEELPGYSHLSRGSNTQAMSESNNEYRLIAHRDVGLRPLLADIEDLINTHILPRVDKDMSKLFKLTLAGLEKEDPERESTRIQQDMAVHMTYNDVLERVEKEIIPPEAGGKLPLNQQFMTTIAPYLTVGQIMEYFLGMKDASKDPRFNYYRDPFFFQYQSILLQKAQMAIQMQMQQQQMQQQEAMQQQQAAQGQQPGQPGQDPNQPQDPQAQAQQQVQKSEQLAKQAIEYENLFKANLSNLDPISKMILDKHKALVDKQMSSWEADSKKALDKILDIMKVSDKKKE